MVFGCGSSNPTQDQGSADASREDMAIHDAAAPDGDVGQGDVGSPDMALPQDMSVDAAMDAGMEDDAGLVRPDVGLCETCELDSQCPSGADCVTFGPYRLCLTRVASEFSVCPRTFEAASLALTPDTYYCLPTEGCCIDEDDDGYGQGQFCAGADCNDADEAVYPGADEFCNGTDNDCDEVPDDAVIDCPTSGCEANGAGYVGFLSSQCVDGACELTGGVSCGLYACAGGHSTGDACAVTCDVGGLDRDDRCVAAAHCDQGVCVADAPD